MPLSRTDTYSDHVPPHSRTDCRVACGEVLHPAAMILAVYVLTHSAVKLRGVVSRFLVGHVTLIRAGSSREG
jgi:hypothetical protein